MHTHTHTHTHARTHTHTHTHVRTHTHRLSQQLEPDPVVLRKPRSTTCTTNDNPSPTQQLRTSKSHEDLLSPFSKSAMDSLTAADTKLWTPQPHHKQLGVAQSAGAKVTVTFNGSPSTTKKISTLPSNFRGVSFSGVEAMKHSVQPHPHRFKSAPSERSMDLLTPTESPVHGGSLVGGGGRGGVSPHKRRFTRGHKKAQSLGSKYVHYALYWLYSESNNITSGICVV